MKTLSLLLLAASMLLCSCGKPRSVASSLTPASRQSLQASFDRLDRALQTHAPSLYTNLAPPATTNEIQTLRAAVNGNRIESLEAWYQWHNGAVTGIVNLLPLGYPLSVAEAMEDRRMLQGIPFVPKLRKNAVKLMDDGFGDGFFLDAMSPNPRVFYHMLEEPAPTYYGTMQDFVDFIASGFESGVLRVDEAGELAYDEQEYFRLEEEHLRQIAKP